MNICFLTINTGFYLKKKKKNVLMPLVLFKNIKFIKLKLMF
jgi:hypothetical protein